MGATGSMWWLWTWCAWMGFNLLLLVLYPTFIAPMFNKFQPLEDETLKTRVTALMQRCGFSAKGLFVMDGSSFVTGGAQNPTLTILSLAMRASEYLAEQLRKGDL